MDQRHQRRPTLKDDELDPALSEVSRIVIGRAIDIHKTLGPGFERSAYVNALSIGLKEENVEHDVDHAFDLEYEGKKVGEHRVSLYVDGRFVVQVLAEDREITGFDRDVLRAQLRAAELDLGLIINFHRRRVRDGLVRVLNPDRIDYIRGDGHHDDDEYEDEDED